MGKRDMKNKTPPSGAKSQSLVLRLNTRLFFRQLGIFLCMDLLLVVLALMGQLMWAEKRCADALRHDHLCRSNLSFIGNDCLLQILIQVIFSDEIKRICVKRSKHLIVVCGNKNHFPKAAGILPLSCNIDSILLRQDNIHKYQLIRFLTGFQLFNAIHTVYLKLQIVFPK